MFLENIVIDAMEPQALGRFWEQALGTVMLTDEVEGYETRLTVPDGPVLDLCLPRVPDPSTAPPRLHLDLSAGTSQAETVERLLALGASHLDIGQGDVPWVVLADAEGHPFCVMGERDAYPDTGPIAAVTVRSADPEGNGAFWAGLTGWREYAGTAPFSLRHPSGRGPVLDFFPTSEPKDTKNRLHLDLRLEPGDDAAAVFDRVEALGAVRIGQDWGDLPWTSFTDPSGNEFCFLPARAE
ncbi:MAG: VOC family protein [Pedococcus sp.]